MQGLLKVSEDGVTVLASHVNGSKIKYVLHLGGFVFQSWLRVKGLTNSVSNCFKAFESVVRLSTIRIRAGTSTSLRVQVHIFLVTGSSTLD